MFRRLICLLGSVAASISPASFTSEFEKFKSLVQSFHATDPGASSLVDQSHVSDFMLQILWQTSETELSALLDGMTVMTGPHGLIITPDIRERLTAVLSFIKEKLTCKLIDCPWLSEVLATARRQNQDPTPRIWCRIAQDTSARLAAERADVEAARNLRFDTLQQRWASALAELLPTRIDQVAECCALPVESDNVPPHVSASVAAEASLDVAAAPSFADDDDDLYN